MKSHTITGDPVEYVAERLTLLNANHELDARNPQGKAWQTGVAPRYRRIAVVGGGSAGYLAALALQRRLRDVEVTLIESSKVPIIGVGEATVDSMLPFLHRYLGLDIHDFYRQVLPTWKLGIRFEWGAPEGHAFAAPFDWAANNVGICGSLAHDGDIAMMTLGTALMNRNRAPVLELGDREYFSLLPHLPFAYHLDNVRFVRYLTQAARARGIAHLDRTIVDCEVTADGGGIACLIDADGNRLPYDFYIDCTGFRSLLLGKTLGTPFESFATSLFTDTALVFTAPHGGHIKPYTTARTMNAGWCWIIPQVEDDHCGYVHASQFCSLDEAEREVRAVFPEARDFRTVKFRSGRHAAAWRGNVAAVGNSYGFVEPLESTGLLMITQHIRAIVEHLAASRSGPHFESLINRNFGRNWDNLRWFLAVHYKYNARRDTEFWRAARGATDASGLDHVLALFREAAPLAQNSPAIRTMISTTTPVFYGLAGLDCILLGQNVPCHRLPVPEPPDAWQQRKRAALELVEHALPQKEALDVVQGDPEYLSELLDGARTWCGPNDEWGNPW